MDKTGWFCAWIILAVVVSCSPSRRPEEGAGGGDIKEVSCRPGQIHCADNMARWCNEGGDGWVREELCQGETP